MATLLDEYNKYIANFDKAINETLRKDVAEAVIDRVEAASDPNVYDAYTPSMYERRFSLKERSSYRATASNLTLTIKAHIMSNPNQPGWGEYVPIEISDIITNGTYYGPRWGASQIYMMQPYPRPWMEPGLQDSINDHSAERALENGLVNRGY